MDESLLFKIISISPRLSQYVANTPINIIYLGCDEKLEFRILLVYKDGRNGS